MDYRLLISVSIFLLIISLERWHPIRFEDKHKFIRWITNIGIGLTNIVLIKIFAAGILVTLANLISEQQIGLIYWLNLPSLLHPSIILVISLLLLDFLIYVQHVASHRIPILWRLHKVHHTDKTLDATTAIRFHPLEIFLSLGYKAILIILFGFDMYTIIIFAILLSGSAIFNHGNINLPKKLDGWLKKVIITPNVHFIHHSTVPTETNSNYGFFLIWWDKIFSTYQAKPHQPLSHLKLGLEEHEKTISYFSLLFLPFNQLKNNK
jgi:sterol desaturase/sphingolipid hydroxylase (fatty acid hydroxylase superfamily)